MINFTAAYDARISQALRRSRLRGLRPSVLGQLHAGAHRLDVPRGTLLPLPCDQPHLGLVISGVLRVSLASPDGRVATLRYLRSGDLIGAPSIVGQATTIADFRAVVDTTVLVFDVELATALAREDAGVALAIAEELGLMLRACIAGMASLAFGSIRQRIARHLLDLAIASDLDGRRVALVNQQELADAIGSVREVVARSLAQFREERLIATRPARVVILDTEGLADVARGEDSRTAVPTFPLAG